MQHHGEVLTAAALPPSLVDGAASSPLDQTLYGLFPGEGGASEFADGSLGASPPTQRANGNRMVCSMFQQHGMCHFGAHCHFVHEGARTSPAAFDISDQTGGVLPGVMSSGALDGMYQTMSQPAALVGEVGWPSVLEAADSQITDPSR